MTWGDVVWTIGTRGKTRIVAPAGRIDETAATGFAERLNQEIEQAAGDGVSRVAIDLADVEYMSSRGLRGLTLAQRKGAEHGITLVLAGPNEIMREILAISRYDLVFEVFDTIEQAAGSGNEE